MSKSKSRIWLVFQDLKIKLRHLRAAVMYQQGSLVHLHFAQQHSLPNAMPICIECRYPVPQLYHSSTSSKRPARPVSSNAPAPGGEAARSHAGPGDVRLTQCPRCKRFADKYVEHDFVVLFIDLVLVKPQVYRHLLFNKLGREDDSFDVRYLCQQCESSKQEADIRVTCAAFDHASGMVATVVRRLHQLVTYRVSA
jgi:hypothetical protein